MAGKTIEEFKAAQGGDHKREKPANILSDKTVKNSIAVKGLDSQAYIIDMIYLQKIQLDAKPTKFAGVANSMANNSTEYFEYQGFMTINNNPSDNCKLRASVN